MELTRRVILRYLISTARAHRALRFRNFPPCMLRN